jgi:hypothetical protein
MYDSCSLGYSAVTFMASYNNYPGGYALKTLHEAGEGYMGNLEYMKLQHLCPIVKLQLMYRYLCLLKIEQMYTLNDFYYGYGLCGVLDNRILCFQYTTNYWSLHSSVTRFFSEGKDGTYWCLHRDEWGFSFLRKRISLEVCSYTTKLICCWFLSRKHFFYYQFINLFFLYYLFRTIRLS